MGTSSNDQAWLKVSADDAVINQSANVQEVTDIFNQTASEVGSFTESLPVLNLSVDWNDVNNIDAGSNREIDGTIYTTDTTIRISGLIDNPETQVAVGVISADNYIFGQKYNCRHLSHPLLLGFQDYRLILKF